MKIKEFLANFYCKVDIKNQGNETLTITTGAFRRSDNIVIDRVSTTYDILEMADKIADSHTMISLMPFDWEYVVEYTKRSHLDYFVQRFPIEDFYSFDKKENPDISMFYI